MAPSMRPRRSLRWAAVCVWVSFAFAAGLPGPGAAVAQGAHEQALPPALDLPDEAFFDSGPSPTLTVQLLESRFVGVALRAPRHVDVDQRSTLPLLVASRFDGARDWELPFRDHGWLVGIDLRSGKVSLAAAFGSARRPAPVARGSKPSGDELRSHGAQVDRVDGRSRLDIPWQPGCWAFRLVYHDWISNRVVVHLQSAQAGPPGGRRDEACPPPSSAGSQVSFERQGSSGGAVRVAGRFVVPVDTPGAGRKDLPATLFIATRDGASPQRFDWQIPVEVRPGMREVSGVIDHALPAAGHPPPSTVAYLVVAGQVHGPRPWSAATRSARP